MDIIDKIRFESEPVPFTPEEVSDAYRTLFADTNLAAKIVLKDLMDKANYGSRAIAIESNMKYYFDGMSDMIDMIKSGINSVVLPEDHYTNVDDDGEQLLT